MTNTNELKAYIAKSGLNMGKVSCSVGLTLNTLSRKVHNKQEFKASEIQSLCTLLNIENKDAVFFA